MAALLVGALLAAVDYWPVFLGRTPLPAEIVLNFPPWNEIRGGPPVGLPHAEMGDSVTQFYPWRVFTRSAYLQGVLPTWNPHLLLGSPFLANSTSALFYPVHVLYLVLPAHIAWSLAALLRTMLAVFFTALLARELGASRTGALAAGLIYAHCGFMVSWQVWPHSDAALWLPLALYGVYRLRFRPSRPTLALTGFAFAMPVLAGHPEIAVYVTLAGLAFGLFCLLLPAREGSSSRPRYVLLFSAAGLLALGLAAVQVLPTLEWVSLLGRSTEQAWNRFRPLPELVSFVSRHARAPLNPLRVPIPEGAAYAGIFTLLMAPLALASRRKAEAVFFLLLLMAGAQVAYGFGPLYHLSLVTPVFKAFPNNRLILFMDLSLAILASLGLTAVQQEIKSAAPQRTWRGFALASILLPASLLALAMARSPGDAAFGGWFGLLSSWVLLAAGACLLSLALLNVQWLSSRSFGTCALLLLAVDLTSFAQRHVPFFPAHQIFPEPRVFHYLRTADPRPSRMAVLDSAAPPNAEMVFGCDSPTGYDFVLRRTAVLVGPFAGGGPQAGMLGSLLSERVAGLRDRRLDLMNVKYFLTTRANASTANLEAQPDRFRLAYDDGAVQVFENRHVLPRAFLVPLRSARTLPNDEAVLARLADPAFNPAAEVLLTTQPPPAPPGSKAAAGPPGILEIETGIGRTRVRASAAEPSILVLSESDYPGWTASVDGRKERLLRTDYAFKGVALSPGAHEIEFLFEPVTVRAGLAFSALSVLALLGLCMASRVPAGERNARAGDRTLQ